LGLAVYFYALTPLDYVAMRYNVSRILAGDSAPSVQITEHPISAEGLLALSPLLDCPDTYVKSGVAVLLDERRDKLEAERAAGEHWTAYQMAESLFLRDTLRLGPSSLRFAGEKERQSAWARFKAYAYQWY
jgi:hypothetical protein